MLKHIPQWYIRWRNKSAAAIELVVEIWLKLYDVFHDNKRQIFSLYEK